jgi:RNA polymerase sigma factor (sigma-70 family)
METARADPSVLDLVTRAREGNQDAWDAIVDRYSPLIWSACRRFGMTGADADDVAAHVWLRLVERLDTIRQPAALPGWLASTTRNECLQVLRSRKRSTPVDVTSLPDVRAESDDWLLREERHIALRAAFRDVSERCRALLSRLFGETPAAYTQIAADLGIAVGSIGPARQRCLDALRSHPLLAALNDEKLA